MVNTLPINRGGTAFAQTPSASWSPEKTARWADAATFADSWPHDGWSPDETLCVDYSAIWGFSVYGAAVVLGVFGMTVFGTNAATLYVAGALLLFGAKICINIAVNRQKILPVKVLVAEHEESPEDAILIAAQEPLR